MAVVWAEGLDIYNDINDFQGLDSRWNVSGGVTIQTSSGRFNGGAIRVVDNIATSGVYKNLVTPLALGSTGYYCFSYKQTTRVAFAGDGDLLRIHDTAGNLQARLTINSNTGVLSMWGESAQTATSQVIALNNWYFIEFKVTTNTSSGAGALEVRVGGSVVGTVSGIAVGSTAKLASAQVRFLIPETSNNGITCFFDDLFMLDTSGSVANTYLGDSRIDTVRPNNDGTTQNWTSSSGTAHNDVDDGVPDDGDATYISSNTINQVGRFLNGVLVGAGASIGAIVMRCKAKKSDAGTRTVKPTVHSGSSDADGTPFDPGPVTYGWNGGHGANVLTLNPNGSVAWTDATVNSIEVGVKLQS